MVVDAGDYAGVGGAAETGYADCAADCAAEVGEQNGLVAAEAVE